MVDSIILYVWCACSLYVNNRFVSSFIKKPTTTTTTEATCSRRKKERQQKYQQLSSSFFFRSNNTWVTFAFIFMPLRFECGWMKNCRWRCSVFVVQWPVENFQCGLQQLRPFLVYNRSSTVRYARNHHSIPIWLVFMTYIEFAFMRMRDVMCWGTSSRIFVKWMSWRHVCLFDFCQLFRMIGVLWLLLSVRISLHSC